MKVKSMEFTFDFKRRKINATCLKFKPVKKVMYRVFIPGAKEEDEVFVFMRIWRRKRWSGLHCLAIGRKKKQRR